MNDCFSAKYSNRELHGGTMKGTMLAYQDATVYGYNGVFWKSLLKLTPCFFVVDRLTIRGHENGTIHDEEISIGGWQTMSIFRVIDRVWQGKRYKTIRGRLILFFRSIFRWGHS